MEKPVIIKGGLAVDDRGEVGFVNDFQFTRVKRFYTVRNHSKGFVRAWHGHRKEKKYFTAVTGTFLVCLVKIDDWENPSPDLPVERYVLSAKQPAVLAVPTGYANGTMALTDDAVLMVFSSKGLQESLQDDIRFASRYWDPWNVEER